MSITLSALQKQRYDTAANWTAENPTLLAGEIGIESDTGKIKIGNGSTAWASLGYQGIIPSSGAYPLNQLLMPSGTVSAPSISFDGDTNLGIYRSGTDQLSFTTAGTERLRIDAAGQIEAVSLGTAAAPTFSFTGDPNTGLFSPGADQVAISTDGTGRLFVDASGNVGIGGSPTPYGVFTVFSSGSGVHLNAASGTAAGINFYENGTGRFSLTTLNGSAGLSFYDSFNATERMKVDSSGRLLIGTSSAISTNSLGTNNTQLQVQAVNRAGVTQFFAQGGTTASNGYFLELARSRGTTAGSTTTVVNGDALGAIVFSGANGSTYLIGAEIRSVVDNTISGAGTLDMPGRLVFSTTPDSGSTPTERLRLTSDGVLGYNQPTPVAVDTTATLTVSDLKTRIITSTTAAAVTMTLPTGTLTEGGFSGLYTNFTFEWSVINTGATNAVTVQGGTAHTLVGSGTVAAGVSGRFASRRTAANTFVTYRLS